MFGIECTFKDKLPKSIGPNVWFYYKCSMGFFSSVNVSFWRFGGFVQFSGTSILTSTWRCKVKTCAKAREKIKLLGAGKRKAVTQM